MTDTPDFDRVRRGADPAPGRTDPAEPTAADRELRIAQDRIAELEHELGGIRARALAVDQIRRQRQNLDQQAAAVEIRRHEMLHEAGQEIERLLAEADQEIDARRTESDHPATMRRHGLAAEMRRVEAEARGRADALLRSARSQLSAARETAARASREADRILAGAQLDAAALRARVRAEAAAPPAVADREPTTEDTAVQDPIGENPVVGDHPDGVAQPDQRFEETKARYEEVLAALDAKVTDLRSTFEALVTGLRAIADGGLANLPPDLDRLHPGLAEPRAEGAEAEQDSDADPGHTDTEDGDTNPNDTNLNDAGRNGTGHSDTASTDTGGTDTVDPADEAEAKTDAMVESLTPRDAEGGHEPTLEFPAVTLPGHELGHSPGGHSPGDHAPTDQEHTVSAWPAAAEPSIEPTDNRFDTATQVGASGRSGHH
ncbi:MAG: hypothetical protein ACK5PP_11440 [Acidimicrobiales bacterium]